MPEVVITLKLHFLDLNNTKAVLFSELQAENTRVGNEILSLPFEERKKLTTKHYADHPLTSYWMNQTIRNVQQSKKTKEFKCVPLETNNQGWTPTKVGDTFSVGFTLERGRRGARIPLEVHTANHQAILELMIAELSLPAEKQTVKRGNLQLQQSRKGHWFALISVTLLDVPEAKPTDRWVGVDRGQNHIAVAVNPEGQSMFFSGGSVKQVRRKHQAARRTLQAAGKHNTLKQRADKEQRTMRHINHKVAKEIVAFAKRHNSGIILEDLSGIRNARQRQAQRSDSAASLQSWAYYDLEQKIQYKAAIQGVPVEKRPAAYTSQTCSRCGHLNKRNKHDYRCSHCQYRVHSDWNAGMNLSSWDGKTCKVKPQDSLFGLNTGSAVITDSVQTGGVHDAPPNSLSHNPIISGSDEKENLHP